MDLPDVRRDLGRIRGGGYQAALISFTLFIIGRSNMKSIAIILLASAVEVALHFPGPASAQTESVIYSFCRQKSCTDGSHPQAELLNVRGVLYGTTKQGGSNTGCTANGDGCGTVFSIDPANGNEKVLYSFCRKRNCTDGFWPTGGLIDVNGMLFGTTGAGGLNADGTVFEVDPKSGTEKVVYSFDGIDGLIPSATLLDVEGTLYGTTFQGGTYDEGTAFSVDSSTGAGKTLHSFGSEADDGTFPVSDLIAVGGTLYGTTESGGAYYNNGTVFAVDPETGAERAIYSFCRKGECPDGSEPMAGVININGTLFGTTLGGGVYNDGTVFSLDPRTHREKVLYSFKNDPDGIRPYGGLADAKGTLYGTTFQGGASGYGTAFAVNRATRTEGVLYSFCGQVNCSDGAYPAAGVIVHNGQLYGTVSDGGANQEGAVFLLANP